MKTIYLDENYMCHLTSEHTIREIQTNIFDDFIDEIIPFYRYIPEGASWETPDGFTLHGLFVQATDSAKIDKIISDTYIKDMQNALDILGVES